MHEDLPEKTVCDSYSHGEWKKGTRRKPDSICKICKAECGMEHQLSAHMKSLHPEERPYRCSECRKAFNTHNDLNTHILSVHKEKTFQCKLCPYMAANEYKMAKHLTVHSSEKYGCTHCDVELNSQEVLREHTKRHIDDSWYQCNQCTKAFMSEVSLRQHVQGKHGEGYHCRKCSQWYDSLVLRSRHEK